MRVKPGCPCDGFVHPRKIVNLPGLPAVDYRVGDFTTFREALLVPGDREVALAGWNPAPGSDLGLQLLEWWAYLADILTFYNERAIQEVLLGTAQLPSDVRRIVRLLGYRPRPGIAATGVVAAIAQSPDGFVVPHGFPIEGAASGAGPAQIFEVDTDVKIGEIGTALPPSARFPEPGFVGRQWTGRAPADQGGQLRNAVDAKPHDPGMVEGPPGALIEIALDGVVTTVKPGDILLVMKRNWLGHVLEPLGYSVTVVRAVEPVFDAAAHAITQVTLLSAHGLPGMPREDVIVLKPTKMAHLWLYHQRYPGSTNPALIGAAAVANVLETIFDPLGLFTGGGGIPKGPPEDPRVIAGVQMLSPGLPHGVAHLEAITRGISTGDPVLFEKRSGGGIAGLFDRLSQNLPVEVLAMLRTFVMQLVKVTGYSEDIWYGNAPQLDRVGWGPPVGPPTHGLLTGGEGPIPIPHSRITFEPNPFLDLMAMGDLDIDKIVMHYGWQEIGHIVPSPPSATMSSVDVAGDPAVPPDAAVPVIIEDARGRGKPGWLGRNTGNDGLVPPLRALWNLLPVSRGQSVRGEALGSGDPLAIHQELVLSRSPLTYLAEAGPHSVNGYRSTLRIRVDGIEWTEVPSFYGRAPGARVFVTREDDEQKTHVRFGDGEQGARLPAGVDNVVADYRYGSGATTPPPGTLTSILRPIAGLTGVVNPIPVGGGADPDPPERIRRYAPRSILTFGRAVSGDDYETLAAQTPGVRRARARWGWDAASQRSVVKVYVGDDAAAVANAREALRKFGDPNRHVEVELASPISIDVSLRLEVDPAYDPAVVRLAAIGALLDPQAQPFGAEVVQIGQVIYDSHIVDACLRVPGVVAVHGLRFGIVPPPPLLTFLPLFFIPLTIWPPPIPPLPQPFGPGFDPAEFSDPLILAWRLGYPPEDLFDPFKLANRIPRAPTPAPISATPAVVISIDPGPRHIPAHGRFFLLEARRLHVDAEVARHVL